MKLTYPGLTHEKLPSGADRWRVRIEGRRGSKITLPFGPDNPSFTDHYFSARRGIKIDASSPEATPEHTNGIAYLTRQYEAHMAEQVAASLMSPLTQKQRQSLIRRFRNSHGKFSADLPPAAIYELRDALASTPGTANNMVKTIRAMFAWAEKRGLASSNPAAKVEKIAAQAAGARPWTPDDLRRYRQAHPPGSAAHVALTVFAFTACRIGDAIWIGREQETTVDGLPWLEWQPRKKGSRPVSIPILPPLADATANRPGPYNITESGKPFASPEGLRNRFKKWCISAELGDLSSHGIRKAAGAIMSDAGCSQYQIMAVHGHANARTSEVYTQSADRRKLAQDAMNALRRVDW